MSDKSKGKQPKREKPQTSQDYQMVPQQHPAYKNIPIAPSPAITTQNPYAPLSQDFPAPTFLQAAKTPTKLRQSSSTQEAANGYHIKPIQEKIAVTRYVQSQPQEIANSIAKRLFPPEIHWQTSVQQKNLKYYELILIETRSIELTHRSNPNSSQTDYSRCFIKKVVSAKEWGPIHQPRAFSVTFYPNTYNYVDYQEAWYRFLLLRPGTHSWFINFHDQCDKDFPIWFYDWWRYFGGSSDIIPKQIQPNYAYWLQHNNSPQYMKELHFFAVFCVPWIFCWTYKIDQFLPAPYPYCLVRDFRIKWWPKYWSKFCSYENIKAYTTTGKKLINFKDFQESQKALPSPSKTQAITGPGPKPETSSPKPLAICPAPQKPTSPHQKEMFQKFLESNPELSLQYTQFTINQIPDVKVWADDKDDSSSAGSVSYDPFGGPLAQDPHADYEDFI